MNFLRTQSLQRIADILKLYLNGAVWKTQSKLNVVAGQGLAFSQVETKDTSTLTVSLSTDGSSRGYQGMFWSTVDQTAANTTTSYSATFTNAATFNSGVTLVDNSKITFQYPGVYNLQISMQFVNTDSQINDATIWFRKNGNGSTGDVADSASQVSVPNKHGSIDGNLIFAVNLLDQVQAGDYFEIIWAVTNTAVSVQYLAGGTTPTTPAIPSIILTATQV
jgi:hypothetical protein